jgi:N-formylglutamate deformylase
MEYCIWTIEQGSGPVASVAIHGGHGIRSELAGLLAINEKDRLREEDPFTARLTEIVDNRIIASNSRFEVDLNRPREKAVYRTPEDAWGLNLWEKELPEDVVERSLIQYDTFYDEAFQFLKQLEDKYGRFIVLDIHSYCHRRNGPDSEPEPLDGNPDINVGTGTMNRLLWANVVDRFIGDLRSYPFEEKTLDVRENIRFRGGYFSKWVHEKFPETGCCLAIEVKKIFMDEWSGKIDNAVFNELKKALESTLAGLLKELNNIDH